MSAKLQPFRDETVRDSTQLRVRLNDMVERVNDVALAFTCVRVPNVRQGETVVVASPGFQVGAVVLGGLFPTAGGDKPVASAPWVSTWLQLPDGRITITLEGVPTALTPYAASFVLFQLEGT